MLFWFCDVRTPTSPEPATSPRRRDVLFSSTVTCRNQRLSRGTVGSMMHVPIGHVASSLVSGETRKLCCAAFAFCLLRDRKQNGPNVQYAKQPPQKSECWKIDNYGMVPYGTLTSSFLRATAVQYGDVIVTAQYTYR